jgi:two-component system chemotaxis response regulator CheB
MQGKIYTRKLAINKNIIERWRKSEIVVLGGSAGSFKILYTAVRAFPPDIGKAVVIVIHRQRNFLSEIEELFAETSHLKVKKIADKVSVKKNTIYIAPANYHTLIEKTGHFSLDVSDAVWYSKPSIDVTFESVADAYADRATAILFSGANQDGAAGLLKLRNSGALTIVQNPEEAEMPEMPQAAVDINAAEFMLGTEEIFELLRST